MLPINTITIQFIHFLILKKKTNSIDTALNKIDCIFKKCKYKWHKKNNNFYFKFR